MNLESLPFYDDSNIDQLVVGPKTEDGAPECLPRRTVCGSPLATGSGMVPVLDFPDMLPDPKDFKEIVTYCHAQKIFPMYHRLASGLPQKPSQNGFGHCWNYGITHATEDCRAAEGQPAVKLAPNSLAWLVNWRNQGYFCDETIAAVRQRGIAPASMVPEYNMNPREFDPKWQEEALKYRALEWWDTKRDEGVVPMIRQCLAVLRTGRPGYIAYNWWGHALAMAGMEWDERQPNNVVWIPFNSHADGLIRLAGSKGVPDEFYGVRAGSLS